MANFRRVSRRAKWILNVTAALAFSNFVAFWIASLFLGGDALNGHMTGLHHFLCAHGGCTEVTRAIWAYSYWHALTAMGGILLVFVEMAIFVNTGEIVLDFDPRA